MTSAGGDSSEGASQHDGQEPSFAQLRRELDDAHVLLAGIQGSTTFRAAAKASRVAQRLVPPGSRRRLVVRRLLGRRGPGARTAPASALESRRSNLQRLTSRAALDGQAFTVVVWSRPGGDLRRTLASLRAQTWSHWQVALMEPAGADRPPGCPSMTRASAAIGTLPPRAPSPGCSASCRNGRWFSSLKPATASPPIASTRSRRHSGATPSSTSSPGTTRSPPSPATAAYGSVPRGRRKPCSPPTTWTEPLPCAHRAHARRIRRSLGPWRRSSGVSCSTAISRTGRLLGLRDL